MLPSMMALALVFMVGLVVVACAAMLVIRDAYSKANEKHDVESIIEATLRYAVIEARKIDLEYEQTLTRRREMEIKAQQQQIDGILREYEEADDQDHIDTRYFQQFGFDPNDPNALSRDEYLAMMQGLGKNLVTGEDSGE